MRVGKVLLKYDEVTVVVFSGEMICGLFVFCNVYNSNVTSPSTAKNSCGSSIAVIILTGIGIPLRSGTKAHPSSKVRGLAFATAK